MPRDLEVKQKKHKSVETVKKRRIEPSKRVGQNLAPIRTVVIAKATLSARFLGTLRSSPMSRSNFPFVTFTVVPEVPKLSQDPNLTRTRRYSPPSETKPCRKVNTYTGSRESFSRFRRPCVWSSCPSSDSMFLVRDSEFSPGVSPIKNSGICGDGELE